MGTELSHADQPLLRAKRKLIPAIKPGILSQQKIILILSLCMALQITGFVMVLPLFARRFGEFGAGVKALQTSVMAAGLAGSLAAPLMGTLADRFGRRLLVIGSLAIYVLSFVGYLVAASANGLILMRAVAAAFTAGLVPAMIGIVADIAPVDRRGQWIGFVSGGASFGWIAGPILGGVFYDRWSYEVAVLVSIFMGIVSFLIALFTLPETRKRDNLRETAAQSSELASRAKHFGLAHLKSTWTTFRTTLPSPVPTFFALLWVPFAAMFAWAFIEPSFMFHAYDDLDWTSTVLGVAMSTYGVACMLGEFGLSHFSDRWGRKPVIVIGLILFAAQFMGMAFFQSFVWLSVSFIIAGLGNALFDPALSSALLDITPAEHQGRIQGFRSTANSLGSIIGPALAIIFTPLLSVQAVFLVAVGVVLAAFLVGLLAKIGPRPSKIG